MKVSITSAASAGLIACILATAPLASAKTAKHAMKPAAGAGNAARGKALTEAQHCNSCHGADLKGKPSFSPSLRAGAGALKEYNPKTFARVMDTGVTDDGGKVKPPMPVFHLKPSQSADLWAYFKTQK